MTRNLFIAPLLALGLAVAPALAQPPAPQSEASIPFAQHGGIWDWREDGDQTLYIQDRSHHWYKATLMTPVIDLPFAQTIGFDTGPMDRLDKFSSIAVHGQKYALQSLVRIDGPPPSRQKPLKHS